MTNPRQLREVMKELSFTRNKSTITREELAEGLQRLGYSLQDSELKALMDQLDLNRDGQIDMSQFVASQMDWGVLQEDYRDMWLSCVERTFACLDTDRNGQISTRSLVELLRDKLPASEVEWALEDALVEAGYADADEMDFEGFLRMISVASHDSLDSLDQYESRVSASKATSLLGVEGGSGSQPHFQPELETLEEER